MADSNRQRTEIGIVWLGFVNASRTLFVPHPDDRPLDQYIPLRDKVMELVSGEDFLIELEGVWDSETANQSLHPKVADDCRDRIE